MFYKIIQVVWEHLSQIFMFDFIQTNTSLWDHYKIIFSPQRTRTKTLRTHKLHYEYTRILSLYFWSMTIKSRIIPYTSILVKKPSLAISIRWDPRSATSYICDQFYLRLLLVTMRWDSVVLKMLWMARAASTCLMASKITSWLLP